MRLAVALALFAAVPFAYYLGEEVGRPILDASAGGAVALVVPPEPAAPVPDPTLEPAS